MTNYDKKRKRQKGRQGLGTMSERGAAYQKGFFDGQAQVIHRMTEAGILPKLDFDLKEIRRSYEE